MGALTAVVIEVVLAVWLVASGLPKSIGLDEKQRRSRRRKWYVLAGGGFIIMIALAALLDYVAMDAAAFVVIWIYWFAWLWLSWIIADRQTAKAIVAGARPTD